MKRTQRILYLVDEPEGIVKKISEWLDKGWFVHSIAGNTTEHSFPNDVRLLIIFERND
jgi:hypothetical protein